MNEVLHAENGVFAGVRDNAIIAVASTVYQETMLEIGEASVLATGGALVICGGLAFGSILLRAIGRRAYSK